MLTKSFLKLTRKSYRRKLILFGASIFMSLALTATGFAAWVLSKDATVSAEGAVEVAAVVESSIEMTEIKFITKNAAGQQLLGEDGKPVRTFRFEPLENDNSGWVRWDGVNSELMNLTIQWTLSNYDIVGDYYVEFQIPKTIQDAIDAGYIGLKTGAGQFTLASGTDGKATYVTLTDENGKESQYATYTHIISKGTEQVPTLSTGKGNQGGEDFLTYEVTESNGLKNITVTMNLTFIWGDAFGGMNPGEYYDQTPNPATFEEAKEALNTMKAIMHGINPDTYLNVAGETEKDKEDARAELVAANPLANYKVTVYAKVK